MHRREINETHPENTYFSDRYEEYSVPAGTYPFARTEVWIASSVRPNIARKRVEARARWRNRSRNTLIHPEAFRITKLDEGTLRDRYTVYIRTLIARGERPGENWNDLLK